MKRNTRLRGDAVAPMSGITFAEGEGGGGGSYSAWDAGVLVAASAGLTGIIQLSNGDILTTGLSTNRVYKSTDGGATWDAGVLVASGAGIRDLDQLSNGDILVAGFSTNRVYKSTDNGATWDAGVLVDSGAGIFGITQLSNGDILTTGFSNDRVYKSTDGGATWDTGVLISGASPFGITQLSNGDVLATGTTTNRVYKSTDGGATWDAGVLVASGASLRGITQLSNGDILVGGGDTNRVYKSTDNGATWDVGLIIFGAGLRGITQLSNGDILATGLTTHRVYKSVYIPGSGDVNLLLYSEQLDNSNWERTNVVVTANTTNDPNGSPTADTVNPTVGTNVVKMLTQPVSFVAGNTYVFSVHCFNTGGVFLQLSFGLDAFPGTGRYANFRTDTGQMGGGGAAAGNTNPSQTDLGGGWRRFSITAEAEATTVSDVSLGFVNSATAGYRGVSSAATSTSRILWGAQLDTRGMLSTYIPTTDSVITGSVGTPYAGAIIFPPGATGVRLQATTPGAYWSFQPMTEAGQGFSVRNGDGTIWVPKSVDALYIYTTTPVGIQFFAPHKY